MDTKTCTILAKLNRAFYTKFAADFARTRRGWPPSFELILPHLRPAANVLDLGCGNGRLLRFLLARGWRGDYVGVDSSTELLVIAAAAAQEAQAGRELAANFRHADLLDPDWSAKLGHLTPDVIVALAVLHHIPGAANRARFIADCAKLLSPGGTLIVSTWQFMTSPRLRKRVLPWDVIGLSDADVEPGDYLLSWGKEAEGQRPSAPRHRFAQHPSGTGRASSGTTLRQAGGEALEPQGPPFDKRAVRLSNRRDRPSASPSTSPSMNSGHRSGQRYCAFIERDALGGLAAGAGLELVETFYADGKEGNLNLYGVFRLTSK